MASLSTTLSVLLAVVAGVALIHLVSGVERRFRSDTISADLLDALIPRDSAGYRDLVRIAIPPVVGGMLLAFWPGTNGGVAGAAGFFAAFLSVWPVYQFPLQLLPEDLYPFWPNLKVLFGGLVGMSTVLTYLGFIIVDRTLPVAGTLARAQRWVQILDRLSASRIYGPAKYGFATVLVIGGIYFNRERIRIGDRAHALKH